MMANDWVPFLQEASGSAVCEEYHVPGGKRYYCSYFTGPRGAAVQGHPG